MERERASRKESETWGENAIFHKDLFSAVASRCSSWGATNRSCSHFLSSSITISVFRGLRFQDPSLKGSFSPVSAHLSKTMEKMRQFVIQFSTPFGKAIVVPGAILTERENSPTPRLFSQTREEEGGQVHFLTSRNPLLGKARPYAHMRAQNHNVTFPHVWPDLCARFFDTSSASVSGKSSELFSRHLSDVVADCSAWQRAANPHVWRLPISPSPLFLLRSEFLIWKQVWGVP